jgi:hypothetical protein
MNLYSPVISGSLTVTGSTSFIGNVTMTGTVSATASNATLLDGTGSVGFTTTASFLAVSSSQQQISSSQQQISSSLLAISRSYATTGSNTFTGLQNFSNTCNPNGFTSGASIYTAGGLQVTYDSYFSSSIFVNGNLTVYGTQSVVHVSSSQFNVGTNIITVNTSTPAIRYGGLSVYDSGSTGLSGSIFWDSEANHWIYANASGSGGGATYSGGMFISGPRSSGLGCEQGTTSCMLLVGQGGDHLTSSQVYHSSTVTCIPNTLKVGAAATIVSGNMTLGGYPSSVCFGNGQLIYDNGAGGLALNGQSNIQFLTCATASLNLSSAGYVGIGTTTPCRELHVKGEILFQARSPFSTNNSMYRFIPRSADCAFQLQLVNDAMTCETTVFSVCRNAQTVTSFNIENGNVGIGTCNPTNKLEVQTNSTSAGLWVQTGGTTCAYSIADFRTGTNASAFQVLGNSVSYFGGNVGIGTTSPQVVLHVVKTSGSPRVDISTTNSYSTACSLYLAQSGNYSTIEAYNYAGNVGMPLSLNPSGGNVGINNTSPSRKLVIQDSGCTITSGDVTFATQAKGIEVYNGNSGTTDNVIGVWFSTGPHKTGIASGRTNAAANWEVDLRFYTHPTTIGNLDNAYENMRLYGGGNLTINGTLTQNGGLSDCRQKENLVRISNPLDIISCIGGYNFEWKEGSPSRRDFMCIVEDAGLIAQEVETVMPNIVRETKWDCLKTLNYNGITALLVEGMKQQQCTINALKTCLGIA